MSSLARHPFTVLGTVTFIALAGLSACSSTTEEEEPNVDSIRLTIGSQTITVSNNGTITGGPITITRPATPAITASFLTAAGTEDPIAHGGDFRLEVISASSSVVTFIRTSNFAGTLTGVGAGSSQIAVSLFHVAEAHDDFGPFNVPVTVN